MQVKKYEAGKLLVHNAESFEPPTKMSKPKKRPSDPNQWAHSILQDVIALSEKPTAGNWLFEPASTQWTGRKIRNKRSGNVFAIGDVFGKDRVEIERDGKTYPFDAKTLRERYEPCQ